MIYILIFILLKGALIFFPIHFWGEYQQLQNQLTELENVTITYYSIPVSSNIETDPTLTVSYYQTMRENQPFSFEYEMKNYSKDNQELKLSLEITSELDESNHEVILGGNNKLDGFVSGINFPRSRSNSYIVTPYIEYEGIRYSYLSRNVIILSEKEIEDLQWNRNIKLIISILLFVIWALIFFLVWM